MRKEGCQKQLELRLRPLDLCKGLINTNTLLVDYCMSSNGEVIIDNLI